MFTVAHTKNTPDCTITLPLSKSIINRLLVITHLAGGENPEEILSESSDTVAMQNLLRKIAQTHIGKETETEINVGNAGTVMRFLTALLCITPGKWCITGTERMQLRPVKPLTDALQFLGAELSFKNVAGYPPILIKGSDKLNGGTVLLNAGISSQFISAMMMIAPVLKGGIRMELVGAITSAPYIYMTKALMQKAGVDVDFNGNTINIPECSYEAFEFKDVQEPDWSAAAFWYEIVALSPGFSVLLKGLKQKSVQGDAVLPEIFNSLGVISTFTNEGLILSKNAHILNDEFNYDFSECPDLAQAVIVTCAALGVCGRFAGLKTLRVKETDRIEALRAELTKLTYNVRVEGDQIVLAGKIVIHDMLNTEIVTQCYDDHRMAMAFAPLAIIHDKIRLDEPEVVKKSYPYFWKDITSAGFITAIE